MLETITVVGAAAAGFAILGGIKVYKDRKKAKK